MEDAKRVLVTSGTGKTGRRVAARLQRLGVPVRIGSRAAGPPFDWRRGETWKSALEGVGAVYLAYHPDLATPGALETIRSFTGLAVDAGVGRIVLLSGRGEAEALRSEEVVRASGVRFTVLRSAFFLQNFGEGLFTEGIQRGEVAFLAGDVTEPFVDVEDLADLAVSALVTDQHAGRTYELGGPRLLTFADAVAEISRAAGREIRYVRVTPTRYTELLERWLPREEASSLVELFGRLLDGRNACLVDGVERALGRRPRDLSEYARETAATGAWNTSGVPAQPATGAGRGSDADLR